MKIKLWAIVLAVSLLSVLASSDVRVNAAGNAIDLEKSVRELQKRTQSMAAEIVVLKKRIEELEGQLAIKTIAIPGAQIQPGQPIPRGATPFEFNGMTYYYVPLKK